MADNTLPESNEWTEAIYQLETDDPVIGGADGISNKPSKQLANRTLWLKTALAALSDKIVAAKTTVAGIVQLATTAEAKTGTDTAKAVTPAGLAAALSQKTVAAATTDAAGIVQLSTDAEAKTGTDTAKAVTPSGLLAAISDKLAAASETVFGLLKLATTAEAKAGTDTGKAVTPAGWLAAFTDKLASIAETKAGTSTDKAVTPAGLLAASLANLSQIHSITAAVAANALTATLQPEPLMFRNPTLTNGAPITVSIPGALSVSVPSGATLGTVSGQQSLLALICLYNGGNPVLGVVNLAGGVDLSETNLLSATAISAGATSASTVYASVAVVSSPYRVVGLITLTEAVAGTWATAPTGVQGAGGMAMAAMQSLGFGQTWQNLTASRALGTTYYNTTGRPIFISITCSGNSGVGTSIQVNGVSTGLSGYVNGGADLVYTAIVPPGQSYVATTGVVLNTWSELR
ncbi:MAG TPA: hypothetical protein VM661_09890 [Candidatus Sulfotelmatobacter sp.]|jgi:hypothetical protein|nr:hypothetical protein [Candidatus Sulfotelmatobacter sp.]